MELFRTRVFAILASGINTVATSVSVVAGQGARFGAIPGGSFIRGSLISSSGQIEDVQITGIAADALTIVRQYDGSTALSFVAGDRIECRVGASSMSGLAQVDHLQTNEKKFGVNTGSANALVVTLPASNIVALVNGMEVDAEIVAPNDDVATLKVFLGVTDTGALPIKKHSPFGLVNAVEGDLPCANAHAKFTYDSSANAWVLMNPADTDFAGRGGDYFGSTRPPGYVFGGGQTIGDASSGATARAKADTQTLFELLWNSTGNAEFPIQDSSGAASVRGANATADFNAHKRMPVPDKRDRVTVGKGDMGGTPASRITVAAGMGNIDTTKVGAAGGDQQMQSHPHTGITGDQDRDHFHSYERWGAPGGANYSGGGNPAGGGANTGGASQGHLHPFTTDPAGAGGSGNVQPAIVAPYVLRL